MWDGAAALAWVAEALDHGAAAGDVAAQSGGDPHLDPPPDPPWIVVTFNAWRAQRLGPAWWTLMSKVFASTVDQLETRDARAWHLLLRALGGDARPADYGLAEGGPGNIGDPALRRPKDAARADAASRSGGTASTISEPEREA